MITFLITGKDKSGKTLFTKRMAGQDTVEGATREFIRQQQLGHQPKCDTLKVDEAPADKPLPEIKVDVKEKDGVKTATVSVADLLKGVSPAETFAPAPKA